MGLVFLVVFGALHGWLAAIVMRAEDPRGLVLNVALGIGGALFAGLLVHPLLGGGSLLEGRYSVDGLFTALLGTIAVLLAVNLLRNREVRKAVAGGRPVSVQPGAGSSRRAASFHEGEIP